MKTLAEQKAQWESSLTYLNGVAAMSAAKVSAAAEVAGLSGSSTLTEAATARAAYAGFKAAYITAVKSTALPVGSGGSGLVSDPLANWDVASLDAAVDTLIGRG